MALDPSIILQAGKGVTKLLSPDEIQAQQMESEVGGMKLAQMRQGVQDDQTLRSVYSAGGDIGAGLQKNGLYKQSMEYAKGQAEQQKSQREAQKAQVEAQLQQFELAGRIMSGVNDQATWDRARAETARLFGQDKADQMPQQYDPALIAQNQQKAMTVKDQLEQKHKALTFGETQRHNQATEGNSRASVAQSAANAQMTDSRAREFNKTKEEENNLKREQKQETADLTKSSQIASFDTMLGTLDRLGQHPGLKRSVGLVGALPTMPGSDSANFQAELNTFQSQAFLPMVAQLKGMGALSDAEGKKLTAAVGALDPKMGEKAFRESVKRITDDMESARKRMTGGASRPAASPGLDAGGLEAELKRRGLL